MREWPEVRTKPASGSPMFPRPMKPTRIVSSTLRSRADDRGTLYGGPVVVSEPADGRGRRTRATQNAHDEERSTTMRLGVVFPQTEIGNDPTVIRDYAQAAEGAGYDHLLVFDHVLGSTLERLDKLGRRPPYTDQSSFHEPFVLFGYLGACTQRLELVTGIVILPQR